MLYPTLCWNDAEMVTTKSQCNDRYKDHLDGQLTREEQYVYSGSWRHHLFHTSLPPPPDGEHLFHKEQVCIVFFSLGCLVVISLTY